MSKIVRIVILLVILVGVAFGVLLFNLNTIIKSGVETVGPDIIKVPVFLQKSNISLLSGKGELTGLVVNNPEGYKSAHLFSLGSVFVDMDPMTVLTGNEIHIREVIIDAPHIIYEGTIANSNIKTMMDNLAPATGSKDPSQQPGPAKKEGQDKKVVIDHLIVRNIKLGVSNKFLLGQTINVSLPDIEQKDIGKDSDKSLADVVIDLLNSLNKSIIPAVQNSMGGVGGKVGDALKNISNLNAQDEVQKVTDKATTEVQKVTDKVSGTVQKTTESATVEVQKVTDKVSTEVQKTTDKVTTQVQTTSNKVTESANIQKVTDKATDKATKALDKGMEKLNGLFGK